jgi:hypothetical protein
LVEGSAGNTSWGTRSVGVGTEVDSVICCVKSKITQNKL